MINILSSTDIYRPIKRVFDFISTPENDFQWQYGILATATITNRLNRMGVYIRSIGHFLGRRNLGTYQVVESSKNMKYRLKSISGPLHLHTTYTFDTVSEGTKVNISIHVGTMNFFHMNEQILERRMRQQLKENLTALKDLLEMKQVLTVPDGKFVGFGRFAMGTDQDFAIMQFLHLFPFNND